MTEKSHVTIDEVSKVYGVEPDAVEAVRRISLSIAQGGFVSILGPSGCGKSTLLMMVAGIYPVTSGRITIGEAVVDGPRRDTSVIFQTPVLFPWRTVISNILFPIEIFGLDCNAYHDQALDLLEITGLIDFKDRLPDQLSGGMAQRVPLCRALITNPQLLLMDEPFSALDTLTRDEMNLELLRVWESYKKSVIFITHSIREAVFLSDRVIVLSPRPAVMIEDFTIDLPRPRGLEMQESEDFNRYCARIRASLGHRS